MCPGVGESLDWHPPIVLFSSGTLVLGLWVWDSRSLDSIFVAPLTSPTATGSAPFIFDSLVLGNSPLTIATFLQFSFLEQVLKFGGKFDAFEHFVSQVVMGGK